MTRRTSTAGFAVLLLGLIGAFLAPVSAQASSSRSQNCVYGSNRTWLPTVNWGGVYTAPDGKNRIASEVWWTTAGGVVPTDFTATVYNADGTSFAPVLKTTTTMDYVNGTMADTVALPDSTTGPGTAKIVVELGVDGDGLGDCSVTFTQPAGTARGEFAGVAVAYNRLSSASQATIDLRMDQIAATGAKWFRMEFPAYDLEITQGTTNWAQADKIINSANARGLKVVFCVNTMPRWAAGGGAWNTAPTTSTQRAAVADFAKRGAQRYAGKIHALEVWNEPNLKQFWSPTPSASAYGTLLTQVYNAVKAVSTVPVITGGTGGSGGSPDIRTDTWYTQIYGLATRPKFDAVTLHPYQDKYWNDQGQYWTGGEAGHVATVRSLMNSKGDSAKKIWGTESGFPTGGTDSPWATTEAKQGGYIPPTFTQWADQGSNRGVTGPLFVYTLIDTGGTSVEGYFGLIRQDGSTKLSYDNLRDFATN